MEKKLRGQTRAIYEYLKTHKSITSYEAFEKFGATRLSGIIYNLRNQGFKIESIYVRDKNRYGDYVNYVEYSLIS